MAEYYLAGGGLRLIQTIVSASLWIVMGCLVAGVFRQMMGAEKVRRLFGDHTRWGLFIGWLIGMLLPVCSLGVIPVVHELHRSRVKQGTILSFGLTAPLFNPMSVLFGLTLSDPIAILSFSFCALLIVSFLGMIWNWQSSDGAPVEDDPLPAIGIKRSFAVLYTAARDLVGPCLPPILIGIAGSVLFAVLLPRGFLQDKVEHDNAWAPIVVGLVATPIYSTPLLAMSQIGGMFQHGNSIGGAFSLLILGAGTNLGLFYWFGVTYGFRRVLAFFLVLFVTTIALAYAIDKPLYPKGVDPAGHSHAFDVYSHPFDQREVSLSTRARNKAIEYWGKYELGGTYLLAGLMILGIVFTFAQKGLHLEKWFLSSDGSEGTKADMVLPGWVLGLAMVIGLIVASVMGCYLYYPAPDALLGDLRIVNTEAVLSARNKEWEAAEKWIVYSDDLSRRLEVGVFLRNGSVSEFKTTKAKIYREKLDRLKESVEGRDPDGIEDLAMEVSTAFLRMSKTFRED